MDTFDEAKTGKILKGKSYASTTKNKSETKG